MSASVPARETHDRELLEARARELARPAHAPASEDLAGHLTFTLSGESFAIDARFVLAVFCPNGVALLPGSRPPIRGLTAWRGELLTLLDLDAALDHPTTAGRDVGTVIVLGEDRVAFGIVADAVHDVRPIPTSSIVSPGHRRERADRLVRGVTADATIVIDAEGLLRRWN
jgi:purine-binding chemotaxis protein CheW